MEEDLARCIHESFREALSVNATRPFVEWNDFDENVKEGRRMSARYILSKYEVVKK